MVFFLLTCRAGPVRSGAGGRSPGACDGVPDQAQVRMVPCCRADLCDGRDTGCSGTRLPSFPSLTPVEIKGYMSIVNLPDLPCGPDTFTKSEKSPQNGNNHRYGSCAFESVHRNGAYGSRPATVRSMLIRALNPAGPGRTSCILPLGQHSGAPAFFKTCSLGPRGVSQPAMGGVLPQGKRSGNSPSSGCVFMAGSCAG